MKANELRIGNIVHFDMNDPREDNEPEQGYINHVISANDLNNESITRLTPIPLTEEWLLKFGFKYSKEEIACFIKHYYTLNDVQIKIEQWKKDMSFDESYSLYMDYGYINSVKYVHQLQNIYFALTGEELELK